MKLWKLAATVSLGVFASGSGMLQVSAADFIFDVNFDDKIVSNFDDFTQTFIDTTSDLDNIVSITVQMQYFMDASAVTTPTDMQLNFNYRLTPSGTTFQAAFAALPDLNYSTTSASYFITVEASFPKEIINRIINDDGSIIAFRPQLVFGRSAPMTGRVINIENLNFLFTVNYDFNTTYLFNYFLSDTQYSSLVFAGTGWSGTAAVANYFDYVMTTAGNDNYFLLNTSTTNYGSTRNKFAVDYNEEYFRGNSVGARHKTEIGTGYSLTVNAAVSNAITVVYNYYYLNVSNKKQNIANVPTFEFEQEDCGWDAFNIPCFINNGLAYLVNDAPVISDAFTLLNAGMRLGGQAFGIIGNFSTDNVFGVMILGGLGITAVRWFLKND
jgi:hypothetical protein